MKRFLLCAIALLSLPLAAQAGDIPQYTLTIKNHRYQPAQLKVPADTKIKLIVVNRDSTPEEFESNDLNREKLVMPSSRIAVYIGPLDTGHYKFFGDFHQDTAQGTLIVE